MSLSNYVNQTNKVAYEKLGGDLGMRLGGLGTRLVDYRENNLI